MKRIVCIALVFIMPMFLLAQEKGIHFEHSLSWQQVKDKAQAEHKGIFIDFYTTWCGPCQYMSSRIFTLAEVGNYFNQHFVSIKVQLDTTVKDNDAIKSWYQSGHQLAQQYGVMVFPTYVYFDEKGEAIHRAVGSSDAETCIANAKNAIDPHKAYYKLLNQYKAGKKDSSFLRNMAIAALNSYDMENAQKVGTEYLATQSDLYTKSNLSFIAMMTRSSKDVGFDLILNNIDKVDAILGVGSSARTVINIIMQEEVGTQLPNDVKELPDWKTIKLKLENKYPVQQDEVLAKVKVIWYQYAQDWNSYQIAIKEYMSKYVDHVDPAELNGYALTVFENCKDIACIAEALEWSKRSFEKEKNAAYINTYANILYKMGKKTEALEWEQKALAIADEENKKNYQETIDKMKKGEKTWVD